ncbi:MAG: hypothetical protein J6Q68_05270 [Clostridia bacterium]|nr:hypothetical protein [Clostridia bacterium]
MEFLNGIRIGEYKIDPETLIDEIREKCVDGRKNYTIISVRRTDIEDEKFIEWAKFLAQNKIYFQFAWGQYEPSPFSPECVAKIKEIAGEYFLGIELPELGTIFGCAGKGYKHSPHFHSYEKLSEGRDEFIKVVRSACDFYGYPENTAFTITEATSLISYLPLASVSMLSLETMCGNAEIMTATIRGAAKAAGMPYINYIAHEWYAGVRNGDPLKMKRLRMIYNHSYMNGAQGTILESGDLSMYSHGMEQDYDGELPTFYRKTLDEFTDFVEADKRPEGMPMVRVAFAQGNLDGWSPWNAGSALWNNINDTGWGYSAPEFTNRILYEINTKRSWADVHNFGERDFSGSCGYGTYDIVNVGIASADALSKYDYLIFTGWNTMTAEIYEKLLSFVKGGGKLFMCAAHLNTTEKRNGEISLFNGGDVSELFGCKLDGNNPHFTNSGIKFSESISPDILYPADKVFDPLFSYGYANYARTEITDGTETGVLSDSFYERTNGDKAPAIIEKRHGDGSAILYTALDYPGSGAPYEIYRAVVREIISASHRTAKVKVMANDKVRYTVWESGDVYLLNTDFDVPAFAIIESDNKKQTVTLDPCEIKRVKI